MKKFTAFILAVILVITIAGCGAKENPDVQNDQNEQNMQETPDIQDNVPPADDDNAEEAEPGTTLTVCIGEMAYQSYASVFAEFNTLYPDVELKYEIIPNDPNERETVIDRLRTALMAGTGADLFLLSYTDEFFADTRLSMGNGVFCDLLPLFEKAEIQMDNFIEPVMKAGQIDGKQYIVPIKYGLGLVLTNDITKGIIGEDGFDNTVSLVEGINALSKVEDAGSKVGTAFGNVQTPGMLGDMFNPYFTSDPCPVDYENFTAKIDTDYTKTILSNVSEINTNLDLLSKDWRSQMSLDEWSEYMKTDKYFLFSKDFKYTLYEIGIADYLEQTPNIDVVPMENGGVCAMIDRYVGVRANSVNKENAVNMIKILLSKERQSSSYDQVSMNSGIWPVRKDCLVDLMGSIVAKGISPMSMYLHNAVIFDDVLPEHIVNRLLEIEASVTEARIAPPWDTTAMIYDLCNGKADLDTTMEKLDSYWQERIWDAG